MADGRVANIVISPGIGCTVFTNQTGKAISATFFAQGISTNTNSKATVVVAGTGMTITQNEILWQPSQCIACYSGFISDCPACRAYPDPTKMAAVYTQGVFRSNVGTGRSGTPGYTCGLPRRYCGRSWMVDNRGNYCFASCCRYLDYPSNFNSCGSCINVECGVYCCYSTHYLEMNCCATGGVRFARPMDVFVGVGTTYANYTNPINGTGGAHLWCLKIGHPSYALCGCDTSWNEQMPACGGMTNKEPDGPGKHTPLYLQCFHLSVKGLSNSCDCYSSKCGYEMGCFVPMVYGGTEVINPAIALTNPPLYNGEYSGFPNANGASYCCNCYHGAMWASLITGWFPGEYQTCYDWCCAYFCGTQNACNVEHQRQEGSVCSQGMMGIQYLLTACNTPNVLDSAKRLVAPMDDTGVGAGMTGIPFCYCGSQPTFDNTQGGNPLWLQSSCSKWAHCLNISGWCDPFNGCCTTQRQPHRSAGITGSAMIDWYALTDYKNWCHCDTCIGRLTKGDPGCYQCNPVNNGCWCCEVIYCCMCGSAKKTMCEITCCGGTVPSNIPLDRKVLTPIVMQQWMRGWRSIVPCVCIKPGSSECGRWLYNETCPFASYSYGCECRGYTYNEANWCYASATSRAQTFHMGTAFPAGSCNCCGSGIHGMLQCCYICHCWYCGCCCGPCIGAPFNKPMGCCGVLQDWGRRECMCWLGVDAMNWQSSYGDKRGGGWAKANPYGYHHGISCGIIMHWAGDQVYQIFPAAMDWLMPYCWNNQCASYCCRVRWPLAIMAGGQNMEYCGYSCCTSTPASCRQGPDKFVYPQAMICEGLSNYWLCNKQGSSNFQPQCMYYTDAAGTLACKLADDGAICAFACLNNFACYGTELAMKYFAYNPNDDCHYFMIRTAQEYANFHSICEIKEWGPGSAATQEQLDCCFYSGIKKEFFTREWCCGIFSLDCEAVMCYYSPACTNCCSMRYDGRDHHPQYAAYPVWGEEQQEMCSGHTCCDTANSCLCCMCWCTYYRSRPCFGQSNGWCWQNFETSGHPMYMTLKPQGGKFCPSGDAVGGKPCYNCCRNFSGLGTVFFRKVANFPSIMTDHKYTQPRMCVGCLFRSDTAVWSLPVYNHCCFRWDAFITCDLINWNKQELNITCNPGDQMSSSNYCQILSLENNYYCKCTDCFMAGFDRSGLMELCMSFNQYERTGLLINNAETVYVKSHNATDCFNFQIWGYEG